MSIFILFSVYLLTQTEVFAIGPSHGILGIIEADFRYYTSGPYPGAGSYQTILYSREGDNIVIQKCRHNVYISSSPKLACNDTVDKPVKININRFTEFLRHKINMLRPLSEQELLAYKNHGVTSEDIAKVIQEIVKINALIQVHGGKDAAQVQLNELGSKLKNATVHRIEREIENALKLISDKEIKRVSIDTTCPEDQDLFDLLRYFSENMPCGLSGSIKERKMDCAEIGGIHKDNPSLTLISRTFDGHEFVQDSKTGLIWSGTIGKGTHKQALEACKKLSPGNIKGTWNLPTPAELMTRYSHGHTTILNSQNVYYWTTQHGYGHKLDRFVQDKNLVLDYRCVLRTAKR